MAKAAAQQRAAMSSAGVMAAKISAAAAAIAPWRHKSAQRRGMPRMAAAWLATWAWRVNGFFFFFCLGVAFLRGIAQVLRHHSKGMKR